MPNGPGDAALLSDQPATVARLTPDEAAFVALESAGADAHVVRLRPRDGDWAPVELIESSHSLSPEVLTWWRPSATPGDFDRDGIGDPSDNCPRLPNQALEPIPLGPTSVGASHARVAWTGREFGVLRPAPDAPATVLLTVVRDGVPLAPAIVTSGRDTFAGPELLWSGTEFLVVWVEAEPHELHVAAYDASGQRLRSNALAPIETDRVMLAAARRGPEVGVAWTDNRVLPETVWFRRAGLDGRPIGQVDVWTGDANRSGSSVRLAASDERFLALVTRPPWVDALTWDADGVRRVRERVRQPEQGEVGLRDASLHSLSWTGTRFSATWVGDRSSEVGWLTPEGALGGYGEMDNRRFPMSVVLAESAGIQVLASTIVGGQYMAHFQEYSLDGEELLSAAIAPGVVYAAVPAADRFGILVSGRDAEGRLADEVLFVGHPGCPPR